MKFTVIGGRDYPHLDDVWELIKSLDKESILFSTGSRGVSQYAENIARECGMEIVVADSFYDSFGRQKNVILSQDVIREVDKVYAFNDGDSKEVNSLINFAKKHRKYVEVRNC